MQHRLNSLITAWNRVELRLKEVEQISGEARIPAINELRYAGRQLADALLKKMNDDEGGIESHIIVAEQYIRNADHDVTDATLDYVKRRIQQSLRLYGRDTVAKKFPYVTEMEAHISDAEEAIRNSRLDRSKRDEIYTNVYNTHIQRLISLILDFEKSEPDIVFEAERLRRRYRVSKVLNAIFFLFGLFWAVFTYVVDFDDAWVWLQSTSAAQFVSSAFH
ncbi:hypothetical protein C8J34_12230 [Rhizobium sp. PP-F2F-G36]|nr:hypothetical protein C8J34_12230 [Rhizobium sp. PP-F2F-G36]